MFERFRNSQVLKFADSIITLDKFYIILNEYYII